VNFGLILLFQLYLLAFSLLVVAESTTNFPYPLPLIKLVLLPRLRWPTEQIMTWIAMHNIDSAFKKFFYSDSERQVPSGPGPLAATDGLVQVADYRDGVMFLVIGLSLWDVHVVRTPIEGIVESGGRSSWVSQIKVWVHPGQHVEKGQRIGRILLDSTVVVGLPGEVALAGERLTTGNGRTP
jgi:phosphatidylserine decarboxylase